MGRGTSCTTHQIAEKAPSGRFFRFSGSMLNVQDENLRRFDCIAGAIQADTQHHPQGEAQRWAEAHPARPTRFQKKRSQGAFFVSVAVC